MEILLLILGLLGLDLLAIRYGYDSRESVVSEELGQANLGVAWDGTPYGDRQPIAQRVHPVRHRLAAALYRLADWLYPGVNDVVPA